MSAAAQRDESIVPPGPPDGPSAAPTQAPTAADLRQLAAERIAAHRNRRSGLTPRTPAARTLSDASARPAARPSVRDAVAARYRQSPSYQEFLAAEAQRALEKAQAEADVAARNALAVAEAQRQLLDDIDQWNQPAPQPIDQPLFLVEPSPAYSATQAATATGAPHLTAEVRDQDPGAPHRAPEMWEEPTQASRPSRPRASKPTGSSPSIPAQPGSAAPAPDRLSPPPPLTVRLYAGLPQTTHAPAPASHPRLDSAELEELTELDGEIAFRLAPAFEEHPVQPLPIQANIIEFPRQLVATRKARPRLAEGPLRDDGTPEPQLRIFEVEPEQLSTAPEPAPAAAPAWQSLLLAPAPAPGLDHAQTLAAGPIFDTSLDAEPLAAAGPAVLFAAPVSRRVMALAVDAICVAAGLTAFCALAARLCGPSLHDVPRPALALTAALALLAFAVLYHLLFFCLNEATPGMVYARLGLCTFADTNPSRRAVRRRLWATAVAVAPLGLGLLWTLLDPDRLGWHDRISRMYPRAY